MKHVHKHASIDVQAAIDALVEAYPTITETTILNEYSMDYWAFPWMFPDTGGPFFKPGMIYGRAMTSYTIEVWSCGAYAVLFSCGTIFKVTDLWEGPVLTRGMV